MGMHEIFVTHSLQGNIFSDGEQAKRMILISKVALK
jgi:hypothetical protein